MAEKKDKRDVRAVACQYLCRFGWMTQSTVTMRWLLSSANINPYYSEEVALHCLSLKSSKLLSLTEVSS